MLAIYHRALEALYEAALWWVLLAAVVAALALALRMVPCAEEDAASSPTVASPLRFPPLDRLQVNLWPVALIVIDLLSRSDTVLRLALFAGMALAPTALLGGGLLMSQLVRRMVAEAVIRADRAEARRSRRRLLLGAAGVGAAAGCIVCIFLLEGFAIVGNSEGAARAVLIYLLAVPVAIAFLGLALVAIGSVRRSGARAMNAYGIASAVAASALALGALVAGPNDGIPLLEAGSAAWSPLALELTFVAVAMLLAGWAEELGPERSVDLAGAWVAVTGALALVAMQLVALHEDDGGADLYLFTLGGAAAAVATVELIWLGRRHRGPRG